MIINETLVRVRYAETDKMGYVYYGNYPEYLEVGRVEAMRDLGISYKELEDSGVMMPVVSMELKYIRPAFYDDKLKIKTYIKEMPDARMTFEYEIFNSQDILINKAITTLAFVNIATMRPCRAPENLINAINSKLA